MSNIIRQYLADQKYNTASDETYDQIDKWLEWYQNDVEKFHHYKVYNGQVTTEHERYRLGMAKKVCEDWANLLLNEKVAIKAGKYEKRLEEILTQNNFRVRANQLVEVAFALGTGAFVEYLDADENVVIDYIRADMIYPISWDNGDITECAFGTTRVIDGKELTYLQIHRLGNTDVELEDGEKPEDPNVYYIENKYIDAETGKEVDAPEEIETYVPTNSREPLFQVITPNICNNVDLDSPLGISVYANAISQIKGCDLVYDSYMNEYVLGRKRILVPISQAKMQMEKDGVVTPSFNPNESVFYMLPSDRNSDTEMKEVNMTIRASDHELGIQRSLDVLSLKCGMGTGRYKFESGGVKTATEVISDKSDLYQNKQKHCIIINSAVIAMVRAVSFLDTGNVVNATVDFDDSIIEDSNATIDKNIKLVNAGLQAKRDAIMEIYKCSESEADEKLKRIAEDGQITGQDIDWTGGDDESKSEDDNAEEEEDNQEDKDTDDNPDDKKDDPVGGE